FSHGRPAIERNAPVLSPFLGEFVVFEVRFRWSATAPIERELLRSRENIRAVVADAEWNIAHQRDPFLFRVVSDSRPLFVGDPLRVAEKIFPLGKLLLLFQCLP